MSDAVRSATDTIMGRRDIDRDAAVRLADAPLPALLGGAEALRQELHGAAVSLCAVVNARSGRCAEDCAFCAQSARYSTGAPEYPMLTPDEIADRARAAREMGARRFGIVTSGRAPGKLDFPRACEAVAVLKEMGNPRPCASLGTLTPEMAAALKEAGLSRYHHNLETSEHFFPAICTTHRWEDRLRTVENAKAAGLEVCSGGIFGLGETWEDRIDLAIALRDVEADSVPINFLMPVAGTPLEGRVLLAAEEALRIIALFRFILPRVEIRVAGGRQLVLGERQRDIFRAGANGMMIGDYLTRKGSRPRDDLRMIEELGLRIE